MIRLKRILGDLISLLFPDLCCGCGTDLYHGERHICTKCIYLLPYTDHHIHKENKAARQLWGRVHCNAVMSLLYFKKGLRTQNIIYNLKYKGRQDLGVKLGSMIGEKLLAAPAYRNIDLIVPVPLHPRKERARGYNQSLCIAQGIASLLKVPLSNGVLLRKNATQSQTKKGRYNRFRNMQSAFLVTDEAAFKDKHILLVDDVITTGATLEACSMALQQCKISNLSIATVACAE